MKCPKCSKEFKNERGLKLHLSLKHKKITTKPKRKKGGKVQSGEHKDTKLAQDMMFLAIEMLKRITLEM